MIVSVNLFTSLDGVAQGPGGPDEDTDNGFTAGGWMMPYFDETVGEAVDGWFTHLGELLLGRRTHDVFAAHWPTVTDPDDRTAALINGSRKHVVSSALDPQQTPWADTVSLIDPAELADRVRVLKARDHEGELQVHGSVRLARTLHEEGLVDVYRLLMFPVVLGRGKRLFAESGPVTAFDVVGDTTTPSGARSLELRPKEAETGTVVVRDGREEIDLG